MVTSHIQCVDGKRLHRLIRNNTGNRNRRLIYESLYMIAQRMIWTFPPATSPFDLEDAASNAAGKALEKLANYRARFCIQRCGGNAFYYFSRLIRRRMKQLLGREAHRQRRHPTFSVLQGYSGDINDPGGHHGVHSRSAREGIADAEQAA